MDGQLKTNVLYELDSQCVKSELRSQNNACKVESVQWFAMSAPYRRELKVRQMLEAACVECFVPMQWKVLKKRDGSNARELRPAVHNLVFVHAAKSAIQQLKQTIPFLQWLTRPEGGRNVPLVVPDWEMEDFITVTGTFNEHLTFLRPEEVDLRKGTAVRIVGGPFDGVEGRFLKVRGSRCKRVVLMLNGIVGVAIADVKPDLLELI